MSGQSKQIMRLIRIVGELKKNNYPTCSSLKEMFRKIDNNENIDIACSAKTVHRDINLLKEKFNAPIEFDFVKNGYYLKHHGWDFQCPVLPEKDIMSWVIGAKLASDFIPEPLRSQIISSIDRLLLSNNPDFLDTANINSLTASNLVYKIDPDIFKTVFDGWMNRRSLKITYKTKNGVVSERTVDPHCLTFFDEAWYLISFCHQRNDIRNFAVHRIKKAELLDRTFEFDKKLIASAKKSLTSAGEPVSAEIRCSSEKTGFYKDYAKGQNYKIKNNDDGSIIFSIPEIEKNHLIRFILSEGGSLKLLKPDNLKKEIKTAAEKIVGQY